MEVSLPLPVTPVARLPAALTGSRGFQARLAKLFKLWSVMAGSWRVVATNSASSPERAQPTVGGRRGQASATWSRAAVQRRRADEAEGCNRAFPGCLCCVLKLRKNQRGWWLFLLAQARQAARNSAAWVSVVGVPPPHPRLHLQWALPGSWISRLSLSWKLEAVGVSATQQPGESLGEVVYHSLASPSVGTWPHS